MAQPKLTHWVFYKDQWRHCWLQNTHDDVSHEVVTSPNVDLEGKLDVWIHEDKSTIYTEMQLFVMGINPHINKHKTIQSAISQ